ncbi:uncharacterized protein LOC130654766 [Hydractinia symbiolongicarpus]|uniref:uncharacterized protein LOC130654766 n=1 Tax=Hydractinia symbiolongicarpus TaxID=13093 RepID=UPI002549E8C0|nr:uncharacterized protein LOC130654766 [Hydractinia symbiolongicarpus]
MKKLVILCMWLFSLISAQRPDFYSYGNTTGDKELTKTRALLKLSKPMLLFSKLSSDVYVQEEGIISIGKYVTARSLASDTTVLAAYHTAVNKTAGGRIYYRESFHQYDLNNASFDIKQSTNLSVNIQHAIIVTYLNISTKVNSSLRLTYQVILATDEQKTYVILKYRQLAVDGATVGVSEPFCSWQEFVDPHRSKSLQMKTNGYTNGQHVFLLTKRLILPVFYPFGLENGDRMYDDNEYDDSSARLNLNKTILFFSNPVSTLYISINGFITSSYKASNFIYVRLRTTRYHVLSPYNTDLILRGCSSNRIYYRETFNKTLLDRASAEVRRTFQNTFNATHAVIVTYDNVAEYSNPRNFHSFQVILISDGNISFSIFNYKDAPEVGKKTYVGFSELPCQAQEIPFDWMKEWLSLYNQSNFPGGYVMSLTSSDCRITDKGLYPYGPAHGDTYLRSKYVRLYYASYIPFFSKKIKYLYIHENGVISDKQWNSKYLSFKATVFAAYKVQVNTSDGGSVFYRKSFDKDLMQKASETIRKTFNVSFTGKHALVVTYIDVPSAVNITSAQTFQVTLITDNKKLFAIVKYVRLDDNGALVGYSEPFTHLYEAVKPHNSQSLLSTSNCNKTGEYVFSLTKKINFPGLYPYGLRYSDKRLALINGYNAKLHLRRPMMFLSNHAQDLFINLHGYVSANNPLEDRITMNNATEPFTSFVAIYNMEFLASKTSVVYYRETYNKYWLQKASREVNTFLSTNFKATQGVVITYENAVPYNSRKQRLTFQAVFVSDDNNSYVILNFRSPPLSDMVRIGFGERRCNRFRLGRNWESKLLKAYEGKDFFGGYVLSLTAKKCKLRNVLYPYGESTNDMRFDHVEEEALVISLSRPFLMFSNQVLKFLLHQHGFISAIRPAKEFATISTLLAIYYKPFQLNIYNGGAIYFRESFNQADLDAVNEDIARYNNHRNFSARNVIVVSYVNIATEQKPSRGNTFQAVLATDGYETYAILNYQSLDSAFAYVAYYELACGSKLFASILNSRKLQKQTNVGIQGRHVHLLTSKNCSRAVFYPYGKENGDRTMMRGDNYAELLELKNPINLHSGFVNSLYITTNGLITPSGNITHKVDYNRYFKYRHTIIAPYHLDLDTTLEGDIYYREVFEDKVMQMIEDDLKNVSEAIQNAVVITYINVPLHNNPKLKHTFQVTLAQNIFNRTFLILKYYRLDSSGALTLYSEQPWKVIEFSELHDRTRSDFLTGNTNTNILGQYIFQLSDAMNATSNVKRNVANSTFHQNITKPENLRVTSRDEDSVKIQWDNTLNEEVQIMLGTLGKWEIEWLSPCKSPDSFRIEDLWLNRSYHIEVMYKSQGFVAELDDVSPIKIQRVINNNSKTDMITAFSVVVTVAIIAIFLSVYCYRRKMKKKVNRFLQRQTTMKLDPDRSILEQCNNLSYDDNFEFPRKSITFVRVLGEGAFGEVWMATAVGMENFHPRKGDKNTRFQLRNPFKKRRRRTVVAVKKLKDGATDMEYKDLANELKLLIHIGEHRNIVNLLGACTRGENLFVIFEYCSKGSLLDHLRLRRDDFQPSWERLCESLTLFQITWISVQIGEGMNFLEQRKCVHRDLAARNILLTEDMSVKIADFGLARGTNGKEYYQKEDEGLLPIKWMAPEAILYQKYTSKSDVWSFGVLLWEIYTLGSSPYPAIKNSELMKYLRDGSRMEKPEHCATELHDIMLKCWADQPEKRPSFFDLRNEIDQVLTSHSQSFFSAQSIGKVYKLLPWDNAGSTDCDQIPRNNHYSQEHSFTGIEEENYLDFTDYHNDPSEERSFPNQPKKDFEVADDDEEENYEFLDLENTGEVLNQFVDQETQTCGEVIQHRRFSC